MAELMYFYDRPLPKACRYREFAPWQLHALGNHFQGHGCRDLFQEWLEANPQRESRYHLETLSLMTDSCILFDAARGWLFQPAAQLRWSRLGMLDLSDRQLLRVIVDHLAEIHRRLKELRRENAKATGLWDERLTAILHNLLRTSRRIEHLLDPAEGQVRTLPLAEETTHE